LDTRAIRKAAAKVTYYEIDDAATLAIKQACIEAHEIQADVKFIAGNYLADGLMRLLRKSGFDPDQPTYVIWEGNTMYLTLDDNKAVMEQLRNNLSIFHLSFDYLASSIITRTSGDAGLTRMMQNFVNMGAPWITGIDNIPDLANEVGMTLVENFTTGYLHRRYRPNLSSPVFGPFYSVCTLGSQ
jgi:O-methyltransferase involved in polyketide biosynthesis